MGLKDLNRKLQFLTEQEIDIEGIPEAPEKEVEGEDIDGITSKPAAPIHRQEVLKSMDEIIRVTADYRTRCESLAALLPESSETKNVLMKIATNAAETYKILNAEKTSGIDKNTKKILTQIATNALESYKTLSVEKVR